MANSSRADTESESAPKPTITVSLQQDTLREGETLPLLVCVGNDSIEKLTSTSLHIYSPPFLVWHVGEPGQTIVSNSLGLGELAPHASIPPTVLCTTIGNSNRAGVYNILFTVEYEWYDGKASHQSYVTAEKTVNIDVLGVNEVMGVPLAFASFIVPGMFFWLVLSLCKVPWALGRETDEKLALSVIVSLAAMLMATMVHRLGPAFGWTGYFDLNGDVSFQKLGVLGGTGIILGLIASGLHGLVQWILRRGRDALRIKQDDKPFDVVCKILKLNSDYDGHPVLVTLRERSGIPGSPLGKTRGETNPGRRLRH